MNKESQYKIGDIVYIINFGQVITTGEVYKEGKWENLFDFKTRVKNFECDPRSFVKRHYRPKLTQKGLPYKDGSTELVREEKVYENWTYQIIEIAKRSDGKLVYLVRPLENDQALFQVMEKGLTRKKPEEHRLDEQKKKEEENLGKWEPDVHTRKNFPKKLTEKIYDKNQNVLFGSSMTKGIVSYTYAPGKYMTTGRDFILYTSIDYNGKGCDLSDKRSAHFDDLKDLFPNNVFK